MNDRREMEQEPCECGEPVIQDGVACPHKSPWSPTVSKWSRLVFLPILVLPVIVLAQTSMLKLVLWLGALFVLLVPLRYFVCARCPYYGQSCSTDFGRIVPRLFKKQEGKSMRMGLWLDVVFFAFLCLFPLPEVWKIGGPLLVLGWLALFFGVFAALTRVACGACPLTFCPIGRAGRAFWSRFK